MPGPNLLAALQAHLQTGEVPESLRETLAGQGGTSTVQDSPSAAWNVGQPSPYAPPARRSSAGKDRVTTTKVGLSIEDLLGEEAAPSLGLVAEKTTPAGEVEPALPDPGEAPALQPSRRLTQMIQRGGAQRDRLERSAPPDSRDGGGRKAPIAPRLTTDETLASDLQAALEDSIRMLDPAAPCVLRPNQRWCLTHHCYPENCRKAAVTPWVDDAVDHAGAMAEAMDRGEAEEPGADSQGAGVRPDGARVPLPAPVTYDLPVDLDKLPLFAYVSGPAGVGKTWWAKEVARRAGEAVVLAATTGIASVNLGEGTTINALLKYFDTASLRENYTSGFLEASLNRLRKTGLQRILLDEVSMLHGEQLTMLTRACDNVNQDRQEGTPEIGLILLGDFAQLAPVPDRDPNDPKGWKKLPAHFAFESAEWGRYAEHHLKLTTIRRQADRAFIEALQATRRGAVGEALAFFGDKFHDTTDVNFPGPTVMAKNEAVSKYNQLRLDALTGEKVEFKSERWGKLRPEWGSASKPSHEWGVPETLQLKVGARVMILANLNIADPDEPPCWAYTNGDLGTLVGKVPGGATVKLDRTQTEVTVRMLQRFNEIPLEPGRAKELRAEGHPERISKDGKKEYIGGIVYMPLRLAYATTVHKSQGLSLEQVQVNIRDPFFASPGMLYVALSRARSAEGLRLVGTPAGFRARCTVNPKLKEFL